MKILVLEDNTNKRNCILEVIREVSPEIDVVQAGTFISYVKEISKYKYDLIIVDLLVPSHDDSQEPVDMTDSIIAETRDVDCVNRSTSVLALTSFNAKAEERFRGLNSKDINVVTFDETSEQWKSSLKEKVASSIPPVSYDFAIICALAKEAQAYIDAGYTVGACRVTNSLSYREIEIGDKKGVIVTTPLMGLVSAAITTTHVLQVFKPKLVCMSGICGGVPDEARIYDVVIPRSCHQNDAGKWTDQGFVPEINSVSLEHTLGLNVSALVSEKAFHANIKAGITLAKNEFPDGADTFEFDIFLAPTSSGSAVIAQAEKVEAIAGQRRKISAFEMESYAMYEAARVCSHKPNYFSAKAVVDDGSSSKGDRFHRVACLLSAKVIHDCIMSGAVFD